MKRTFYFINPLFLYIFFGYYFTAWSDDEACDSEKFSLEFKKKIDGIDECLKKVNEELQDKKNKLFHDFLKQFKENISYDKKEKFLIFKVSEDDFYIINIYLVKKGKKKEDDTLKASLNKNNKNILKIYNSNITSLKHYHLTPLFLKKKTNSLGDDICLQKNKTQKLLEILKNEWLLNLNPKYFIYVNIYTSKSDYILSALKKSVDNFFSKNHFQEKLSFLDKAKEVGLKNLLNYIAPSLTNNFFKKEATKANFCFIYNKCPEKKYASNYTFLDDPGKKKITSFMSPEEWETIKKISPLSYKATHVNRADNPEKVYPFEVMLGDEKKFDNRLPGVLFFDKDNSTFYIIFRGTVNPDEWRSNLNAFPTNMKDFYKILIKYTPLIPKYFLPEYMNKNISIHTGFAHGYASIHAYLVAQILSLLDEVKIKDIDNAKKIKFFIVGHSRGGAIAPLALYFIQNHLESIYSNPTDPNEKIKNILLNNFYLINISGPRVFIIPSFFKRKEKINKFLKDHYLADHILHIKGAKDLVPELSFKQLGYFDLYGHTVSIPESSWSSLEEHFIIKNKGYSLDFIEYEDLFLNIQ